MPSLVLIGPGVQLAISNPQTDKHIAFYMLKAQNDSKDQEKFHDFSQLLNLQLITF